MLPGLIIFDCDGVLVDSELIACGAVAAKVASLGIVIDEAEIASHYAGVSATSMYHDLEKRFGVVISEEFRHGVRTRILDEFARRLRPMPDVDAALRSLPCPTCVASSSDSERVKFSLTTTGLLANFGDHIFSATAVRHGKPAPDLFLYAAAAMHVSASDCIVIEDSIAGIRAAHSAGMVGIGFCGGSHCGPKQSEKLKENGAQLVFNHFSEWNLVLERIRAVPQK